MSSLRTSFVAPDNEPQQLIAAEIDLALPLTDLSHLAPPLREERMRQSVQAEANHAFDLSQAPLIRPSLIRLDCQRAYFTACPAPYHHRRMV